MLGAAGHEVHEEIVAEGLRGGEVRFAAAHCGHLLHELDELEFVGEHEGVDHDAGLDDSFSSLMVVRDRGDADDQTPVFVDVGMTY